MMREAESLAGKQWSLFEILRRFKAPSGSAVQYGLGQPRLRVQSQGPETHTHARTRTRAHAHTQIKGAIAMGTIPSMTIPFSDE